MNSIYALVLVCLAVTWTAFVPTVDSLLAPSAGQAACSAIKAQLGASKVKSPLSLAYVATISSYYSQQQGSNRPACVVTPASSEDVQAIMREIRAANSTMAIKAGGHQTNNLWSSVQGGVTIDFKNMKGKTYDAATQQGFYQPGNNWGDVYEYYLQFGRTVVGGRISGIGSGLALGGGLSFLSGQYGLACDGFRALDVVLADGSLVTATADNEYKDLFLSLKGGGNQFGIVTGYTVDTHPSGEVYGGLLIYPGDKAEQVLEAALNFTNTNTDPKAAVIGTMNVVGAPLDFEALGIPISKLSTFVILFNVYDGPDPHGVFAEFEAIPHLFDTRKKQSYLDVANMVAIGHASSGVVSYRTGVHESQGDAAVQTLDEAVANFRAFAKESAGKYNLLSFDFQPVPASLVQASRQRGGNAHASPDGPYYWINYLFSYTPGTPGAQAALQQFKVQVDKTPNAAGKPIFLNDANADQPILQSYGAYAELVAAKKKYDPTNFLATNMGGPRFT